MTQSSLPIVCLMTDFGLSDHYVGTMKAVLHTLVPQIQVIDLTHDIPPQDVAAGAYQLLSSYRYHPARTLFICVVDPGVGSERRILYVEAGSWKFIAPDNGLLSWVLHYEKPSLIIDVSHPKNIPVPTSATFHGRDVITPVGGRLLQGMDPRSLGPQVDSYVELPFPIVEKMGAMWIGKIIALDRFGNVITNIRSEEVGALASKSKVWIELSGRPENIRGISKSYSDVGPGKTLAVEGSSGFLEISVRDGNAAQALQLKRGDSITVHFRV